MYTDDTPAPTSTRSEAGKQAMLLETHVFQVLPTSPSTAEEKEAAAQCAYHHIRHHNTCELFPRRKAA